MNNLPLLFPLYHSAWAVLLDRPQQRLHLVLIPTLLFIPATKDENERIKFVEAMPENVHPHIIYEEITDIWINVSPESMWFSELKFHSTWYVSV